MSLKYDGGNVQSLMFNGNPVRHFVFDGVEIPLDGGGGPTELDFTLTSELTQPLYLTQSSANAVTVDWGDGSTPESPSDLAASLSHTYAEAGNYTVTIECEDGETWSPGLTSGSDHYGIVGKYTTKTDTYPTLTAFRTGVVSLDVSYAFTQCTGLTSVTIPYGATTIPTYCFNKCTSLTSITIPSGVTSIGGYAFENCSGLTSITIPSSVTSIGGGAFSGCSGLTSITIPSDVTNIGDYTFRGCSGLTSITIPSSVTSIGSYAFHNCSGLTSVTIPSSVTSIGSYAFSGCSGLTAVYCLNSTPPTISTNTFNNVPAACPFYVPAASVAAYQAESGWSERAAYIQASQAV